MKKHPIWYLIIGIFILIIPTLIYLIFLVPKLSEEYNILMASGGVIGGFGFYGTSKIPEKLKYSGLFKLASNSFTLMTVIVIVEKFIIQLIGLVSVFIICYIIFRIFLEVWRNARRKKEQIEIAREVARNIVEGSE